MSSSSLEIQQQGRCQTTNTRALTDESQESKPARDAGQELVHPSLYRK